MFTLTVDLTHPPTTAAETAAVTDYLAAAEHAAFVWLTTLAENIATTHPTAATLTLSLYSGHAHLTAIHATDGTLITTAFGHPCPVPHIVYNGIPTDTPIPISQR